MLREATSIPENAEKNREFESGQAGSWKTEKVRRYEKET